MSLFDKARALVSPKNAPALPPAHREDLFKVVYRGSYCDFRDPWNDFAFHEERGENRASFEEILAIIDAGADATIGYYASNLFTTPSVKALDVIIEDHDRDGAPRFSADQRLQLAYALHANIVAHHQSPLDLLGKDTVRSAIRRGQTEMIAFLSFIGAKFTSDLLPEAALPAHNPKSADDVVSMVLPLINFEVNGTGLNDENAGYIMAGVANLKGFKRLEKLGLKKDAKGCFECPTYAHKIAGRVIGAEEDKNQSVEFAKHLVSEGYPIDVPTDFRPFPSVGDPRSETPTDLAMRTGNVGIGNIFLNADARPRQRQMANALIALSERKALPEEIFQLINIFKKRSALTAEVLDDAIWTIHALENDDWKNKAILSPFLSRLRAEEKAHLDEQPPAERKKIVSNDDVFEEPEYEQGVEPAPTDQTEESPKSGIVTALRAFGKKGSALARRDLEAAPREDLFDTLFKGSHNDCLSPTLNYYKVREAARASFDETLAKIEDGADPTIMHDVGPGLFKSRLNALDIVIHDSDDNHKLRFSANERLRLCYALYANVIAHGQSPLSLVSENSARYAVDSGDPQMIAFLAFIGAKFSPDLLADAAKPGFNPESAHALISTLLPHIGYEVNGLGGLFKTENAGHVLAGKGDLKGFKRLEPFGLRKDAIEGFRSRTYAHYIAERRAVTTEQKQESLAFAKYLCSQSYPIDVPTSMSGFRGRFRESDDIKTPADLAMQMGNIAVGNVFLKSGAMIRPRQLIWALESFGKGYGDREDISELIVIFHEIGELTAEMIEQATATITALMDQDPTKKARLLPLVDVLQRKATRPASRAMVSNPEVLTN